MTRTHEPERAGASRGVRDGQVLCLGAGEPCGCQGMPGIAWARETFSSLTPYLAPTRYVNYLEGDATEAAAVAYGPHLDRLRDLKTKWDPDNFFHKNVNILPRLWRGAM